MIPEFPLPDEADLLHSLIPPPIYAEYSPSKLFPPSLRPNLSTGWTFFNSIEVSPIRLVPSVSRKVASSSAASKLSFSHSPLLSLISEFRANSPFRLLAA